MKSKKIFVSLTLVFSMVVMLLPYNVNACVMAKNTEGLNDSSDNSDAVLAYYDVKTQTETLFTEKDLQDTISRAKKSKKCRNTNRIKRSDGSADHTKNDRRRNAAI